MIKWDRMPSPIKIIPPEPTINRIHAEMGVFSFDAWLNEMEALLGDTCVCPTCFARRWHYTQLLNQAFLSGMTYGVHEIMHSGLYRR